MTEYDFDRVTLPDPDPVATPGMNFAARQVIASVIVTLAVILMLIGGIRAAVSMHRPVVETYPEAGPSAITGQTTMPDDVPCPGCECDATWLARFVNALDNQADDPREIRDVIYTAYAESRFTPSAVSDTGDYGICQINKRANPGVDFDRLLDDPEYAADECLRVYRVVYAKCGSKWLCCYRRGVNGGC